ncbi:MAG: hypothetical protein GF400_08435 [Candidatus Eisenbacteria bacterium]|nr:hypothetical protein [Candidatus Eisenbacteria bacterium]
MARGLMKHPSLLFVPSLIAFALLLIPFAATADHASFPPPGTHPQGVDFVDDGAVGGTLYHVDNYTGDVYSITPGGTATLLFNIAEQTGEQYTYYHGTGICFVPSGGGGQTGTFYVTRPDRGASPYTDYVRSFDYDGTHLNTWDVSAVCDRPRGIAWDGTHFWLSGDAEYVKCDTDFGLIETYVPPWGTGSGALDFDPVTGLLYSAPLSWSYITVLDLECNVVRQWYLNDNYRVGVAVGRVTDRGARSIWISDSSSILIEETEDVHYTPIEAASWSAVKALFR